MIAPSVHGQQQARLSSGVVNSDLSASLEAAGDVIVAVNRTPVNRLSGLRSAMDSFKIGDPVVFQLERSGVLMYLAFTVE